MGNLLRDLKITRLTFDGTNYLKTAATGDSMESDALDMADWDGVIFIAFTGDNAVNAVYTMEIEGCATSGGSYTVYDTDAAATFTMDATSGDYKQLGVDVYQPLLRYLKVKTTRATGNVTLQALVAIQYKGRKLPVVQAITAGQFMALPTYAVSPAT